ncbi:hypothetical protein BJ508DRAFT_324838 [Ascobolus immersus RN42]|uniref:Uncharacterized protein n=1 Tax=Ascobolus immersus RN42 TaxID=1160509 RepID=A0A3N4ICS6_ASCIM|nr:hypothetical protein BJ508DRAFT_324838 [Ascobolus immersus RN42]
MSEPAVGGNVGGVMAGVQQLSLNKEGTEMRKLRIVAFCSASSSDPKDDPFLPDFLLLKNTFQKQPNLGREKWFLGVDPVVEEARLNGILHGDPERKRKMISSGLINAWIADESLVQVDPPDVGPRALQELRTAAQECGAEYDILFLTIGHGRRERHLPTHGHVVAYTGPPPVLISPSEVEAAIAGTKARVTMVSNSCFGGVYCSPKFNYIGASNKKEAWAHVRGGSDGARGTLFPGCLDDVLREEFLEDESRGYFLTADGLRNAIFHKMDEILPAYFHDPIVRRSDAQRGHTGIGIPPRPQIAPGEVTLANASIPSPSPSPIPDPVSAQLLDIGDYYLSSNPEKGRTFWLLDIWIARLRKGTLRDESAKLLKSYLTYHRSWNQEINTYITKSHPPKLPKKIEKCTVWLETEEIQEFLATPEIKKLDSFLPNHPIIHIGEWEHDAKQLLYLKAILDKVGAATLGKWLRRSKRRLK